MAKKVVKKLVAKVKKSKKENCNCLIEVPTLPDAPFGYEAYEVPVVNVPLEFEDGALKTIEKNMKEGGFVSKNEYLRHVLREVMTKDGLLPLKTKK